MKKLYKLGIITLMVLSLAGCKKTGGGSWAMETPTPTMEGVASTQVAIKATATPTPVAEVSSVPEGYVTEEPSISVTEAPTNTPTPTSTPSPTPSNTPMPTNTSTPLPTATPAPSGNEVNDYMFASTGLNIRSGAGSNYGIVGEVETGDKIYVYSILDNGWAKIYFNGNTAYVFAQYLSSQSVTPTPTPKPTEAANQSNSTGGFSPLTNSSGSHSFKQELHNAGQNYNASFKAAVNRHFDDVNKLRESVGVSKLKLDNTLCSVAGYRTAEMISENYFSHYHPGNNASCVKDVFYFYKADYSYIGENIANSSISGASFGDMYSYEEIGDMLYNQFYNSSDHYKNMVNPNYTSIGISFYISDNYIVVTQVFN